MNILRLRLVPGTALSEQEIAGELNVSRTPVREAFIHLAEAQRKFMRSAVPMWRASISGMRESLFSCGKKWNMRLWSWLVLTPFSTEVMEQLQQSDSAALFLQQEDFISFFEQDRVFHGMIYRGLSERTRIWKMLVQNLKTQSCTYAEPAQR